MVSVLASRSDPEDEPIEKKASRLSKAIVCGVASLLEIVESMQQSLTSEKTIDRAENLDLLAHILRELPPHHIHMQEIKSLLNYFILQLKGHPDTARIALFALEIMFDRFDISPEDSSIFVERFFNESLLVDLTKRDKMSLYKTFQSILTNEGQLNAVKKMASAFIPGFLQLVELETDPQCLVVCFNMYRIVVNQFPLGIYVEEMFDFPAGYFPIDFDAPPERHGGVTRAQLQSLVEDCLLAHVSFLEPTVRLCMEKLSSDVADAQIDALRLLKLIFSREESVICLKYVDEIWPLIRKTHIKNKDNEQLQESLLRLVTVLAQRFDESQGDDEDYCGSKLFANMIWKDFENNEALIEYEGWRILVAFAGASVRCSALVVPKALNKLTAQMTLQDTYNDNAKQLGLSLLDAACAFMRLIATSEEYFVGVTRSAAEMLIDQACSLLVACSRRPQLNRLISLIESALPLKNVVGSSSFDCIQRFIEASIFHEPADHLVTASTMKHFISACLECEHFGASLRERLEMLGKQHQCVWLLAGLVQRDGANATDICRELLSIKSGTPGLIALCEIVINCPNSGSFIMEAILSDNYKTSELASRPSDRQVYENLFTTALRTVEPRQFGNALSEIHKKLQLLCLSNQDSLIILDRLSLTDFRAMLLQLRILLSNCPVICLEKRFVLELTDVITKILFSKKLEELHLTEIKTSNRDSYVAGEIKTKQNLFSVDFPGSFCEHLLLQCVGLLANKYTETGAGDSDIVDVLLHRLRNVILNDVKGASSTSAANCSESAANCTYSQHHSNAAKENQSSCGSNLPFQNSAQDVSMVSLSKKGSALTQIAFGTLVYLAKGLLMRGHAKCDEVLTAVINSLVEAPDNSNYFVFLSISEPQVFTKDGHCSVRMLYQQRLLTFVVPRLLDLFNRDTTEIHRIATSNAIFMSIQNVSMECAGKYLTKVRPILVWRLDLVQVASSIRHSTKNEKSQDIIRCAGEISVLRFIHHYLAQLELSLYDTLLPSLLLCMAEPACLEQRLLAVQCLSMLPSHFQIHELLPHRRRVLRALPLADRKRLVRMAAARASVTWHLIGEAR